MSETKQTRTPVSLHEKPQRGVSHPSAMFILSVLAGLVLISGLGYLGWQFLPKLDSGPAGMSGSSSANKNTAIAFPPGRQGDKPLYSLYWQTVQQEVAQSLHLDVAGLRRQLTTPRSQSPTSVPSPTQPTEDLKGGPPPKKPGVSSGPMPPAISSVAQEQGVSATQLRTSEINAIQHGFDRLVEQGIVTHEYAEQWMQQVKQWTQDTFNKYMSLVFTQH
jgi:hypothetical protein